MKGKLVRLSHNPTKDGYYDGLLIADETRSDPFLGSDHVINNIGNVIELDPTMLRYISFKFSDAGHDVIVTLMNIQAAVSTVLDRFAEPLYNRPTKSIKQ